MHILKKKCKNKNYFSVFLVTLNKACDAIDHQNLSKKPSSSKSTT